MIRDPYIEREARNAALILAGVLAAGFGIEGFLVPGGFIDGGVTGVSMLLGRLTAIPLPVWLPIINLPFLVVGYRQLGAAFAVRGAIAIGALAVALVVVPYPHVTPDPVLEAVFGGFFLGGGIGLAVRGSAVLDGTEIAALLISRRSHLLKVGDVILAFNVVLFLVAMRTLGVEPALYSILTVPRRRPHARLRDLRARGVHRRHDLLAREPGHQECAHRRPRPRRVGAARLRRA